MELDGGSLESIASLLEQCTCSSKQAFVVKSTSRSRCGTLQLQEVPSGAGGREGAATRKWNAGDTTGTQCQEFRLWSRRPKSGRYDAEGPAADYNRERPLPLNNLLEAAKQGEQQAVQRFLQTEDVNVRNSVQQTPLYWAASNGHPDIVAQLLASPQPSLSALPHPPQVPLLAGSAPQKKTRCCLPVCLGPMLPAQYPWEAFQLLILQGGRFTCPVGPFFGSYYPPSDAGNSRPREPRRKTRLHPRGTWAQPTRLGTVRCIWLHRKGTLRWPGYPGGFGGRGRFFLPWLHRVGGDES